MEGLLCSFIYLLVEKRKQRPPLVWSPVWVLCPQHGDLESISTKAQELCSALTWKEDL